MWKKGLQKTHNIGEMTSFRNSVKSATMQRLKPLEKGQFGSKIEIGINILFFFYRRFF